MVWWRLFCTGVRPGSRRTVRTPATAGAVARVGDRPFNGGPRAAWTGEHTPGSLDIAAMRNYPTVERCQVNFKRRLSIGTTGRQAMISGGTNGAAPIRARRP